MFALVEPVGPIISNDQHKVLVKVLDFTSQVWINCREQTNFYVNPCGDLFANVATTVRDNMLVDEFKYPSSLLYTLGMEYGHYSDHENYGNVAAIMSIFFIKLGHKLEVAGQSLSCNLIFVSANDVICQLENINKSPLLQCLHAGLKEMLKTPRNSNILSCLELAASHAENYALKNLIDGKKDSSSHVVGITLRSIFQACKTSI